MYKIVNNFEQIASSDNGNFVAQALIKYSLLSSEQFGQLVYIIFDPYNLNSLSLKKHSSYIVEKFYEALNEEQKKQSVLCLIN